MASLTIAIGVLLTLLGLGGYFGSDMVSVTALIPAVFGVLLLLAGVLARNPARRKLAMHIAVVVGLLGFLGSVSGVPKTFALLQGETVERPAAAVAQAVMALLTGVFVVFCVRSFIDARRSRSLEASR